MKVERKKTILVSKRCYFRSR